MILSSVQPLAYCCRRSSESHGEVTTREVHSVTFRSTSISRRTAAWCCRRHTPHRINMTTAALRLKVADRPPVVKCFAHSTSLARGFVRHARFIIGTAREMGDGRWKMENSPEAKVVTFLFLVSANAPAVFLQVQCSNIETVMSSRSLAAGECLFRGIAVSRCLLLIEM